MIITVWWEDARNAVRPKNFGPEHLLVTCIADDLDVPRKDVAVRIESRPWKGDGNVLRELKRLPGLPLDAPPMVVLDRDRIHGAVLTWAPSHRPNNCITEICQAIRAEAPGAYDLLLLVNNMETLYDACRAALRWPRKAGKPGPLERDETLNALAFGTREQREEVRAKLSSFDRLVARTAERLRQLARETEV